MTIPMHIVWFKRDLRIIDHAPLAEACLRGPVLPLFAWEPSVIGAEDYARQHQAFVMECLRELTSALEKLGLDLLVWPTGMLDALTHLSQQHPIAAIWSHEETGNQATFSLDRAVGHWCESRGVTWHEIPQHGVVRRLKDRDHWHAVWEQRMQMPIVQTPSQATAAPKITPSSAAVPLARGQDKASRQSGGRRHGLKLLQHFIEGRAANYRGNISSPLTAVRSCSRLSPYLAWGCLSMREVVQACRARKLELKVSGEDSKRLRAGLTSFESRLHWHCHFIQKLESEPALEFYNLHRAYDGLREDSLPAVEHAKRLDIWARGQTGWPLVDACMAMLRQTGWLNFRMRAMLMSTASYLYWLHWREPGLHLAREFLDYEPGIHWPQVQMQSGTTGINTLRMYNPIKQAIDQDPQGRFVRHWLPQLKHVPDAWIFQPWLMTKSVQQKAGCVIDVDYPSPLVNIDDAMRLARAKLSVVRQDASARAEARKVVVKHGSRRGMPGSQRDASGQERPVSGKQKQTGRQRDSKQQELF
jgi:deoxyribodipyrimidine photo-lyase